MFEKMKLKKLVKECKANIEELERKRIRSQAALMEALLKHEQPSDEDVDFFNEYTMKIELERDRLRGYFATLEGM